MNNFPYKHGTIYFWSGTGNSYRVATWMGAIARENRIAAAVRSTDSNTPEEEIAAGERSFFAIVFPTHGFTAPWHILKFVWRLPRVKSIPAYCVATRAGLKFGRFFIPGISGSGTFIVALLLLLKGYAVRGSFSVDMPSNWYSLHPIQSRASHQAIIDRAHNKVIRFMEKVLAGKKAWATLNNLCEMVWGILLSFISLAYLCMGRFFLAKLFFANHRCDGCGICAQYCTVGAIAMKGKEDPRPYWKYNCESCMRCSAFCPRNAVEAGHSWGVLLYFITGVPFSAHLLSWLNGYFSGVERWKESWIGSVIDLVYYYPAVIISYFIFTALLRIPSFNWLFTHTTMTHLSRWGRYREPEAKLKNIAKGSIGAANRLK